MCMLHMCVSHATLLTEVHLMVSYQLHQKSLRLRDHIVGELGKSILSNTIILKENSYIPPLYNYRIFSSKLFL
jgi:hypothetical protein